MVIIRGEKDDDMFFKNNLILGFLLVFICIYPKLINASEIINYNIISSEIISEGVILDTLNVVIDGKDNPVYVLKADLNNPYLKISAMSSNNHINHQTDILTMAEENNAVAAINGNFYNYPPAPIGAHIENNEVMSSPPHLINWYTFFIDNEKKAYIDHLQYDCSISTDLGDSFSIYGLNKTLYGGGFSHKNKLNMYNSYWGESVKSTFFNEPMPKVIVENNIVTTCFPNGEQVDIPENGYVLIADGEAIEYMDEHLQLGTHVSIINNISSDISINTAIGGFMILVDNGQVINPIDGDIINRHPRTVVGISEDQKTVWMITINGGGNYTGMTLPETAELMVKLGVYKGLNLDGGSSATMVAKKLGDENLTLINQPKYGFMFLLPDGLGVFNTASPSELQDLNIQGKEIIPMSEIQSYIISGYDQHYLPIEISSPDNIVISIDNNNCEFNNGNFKAYNEGRYVLTASYQNYSKQKEIYSYNPNNLENIRIIYPTVNLLLDEEKLIPVVIKINEELVKGDNSNCIFLSSNTESISIDESGLMKGNKIGDSIITVSSINGLYSDSLKISVTTQDSCFIATAAFNSKFEPSVILLRHFRDQYLLTNSLGKAFVKFYYRNSPPIAAYIANSEQLKALVRILLLPVIALAYSIMHPIVGVEFIGVVILVVWIKKYYPKTI